VKIGWWAISDDEKQISGYNVVARKAPLLWYYSGEYPGLHVGDWGSIPVRERRTVTVKYLNTPLGFPSESERHRQIKLKCYNGAIYIVLILCFLQTQFSSNILVRFPVREKNCYFYKPDYLVLLRVTLFRLNQHFISQSVPKPIAHLSVLCHDSIIYLYLNVTCS